MSGDSIIHREARLIMLRFLSEQQNRSLTSTSLMLQMKEMFLIDKDRPWVEQQLAYLAEMGAVKITPAGTVKIATLLRGGERHLSWAETIPGVLRSSEPINLTAGE